jgi:hypothetical protein
VSIVRQTPDSVHACRVAVRLTVRVASVTLAISPGDRFISMTPQVTVTVARDRVHDLARHSRKGEPSGRRSGSLAGA